MCSHFPFLSGALLSQLIPPIYMDSLILGSLFHGDHLSRAVYGRLEVVDDLKAGLPEGEWLVEVEESSVAQMAVVVVVAFHFEAI